ncbi:MAG: SRPBCC family protein [Rhodospirillaceae bacterium]|nr:SRPBCC family protein [Rhodospirillaceae bacterium]
MTQRRVTHHTFCIERTYPVPPAKVFQAFADPKLKYRWFVSSEGFTTDSYELDFKVGGWERTRGKAPDKSPYTNDTVFHDIVPNARIVFAYQMTYNGEPISVSLTTVELRPSGAGTTLVFTEQDAFLDGHDDGGKMREAGTRGLLDALGKELTGA